MPFTTQDNSFNITSSSFNWYQFLGGLNNVYGSNSGGGGGGTPVTGNPVGLLLAITYP